MSDSDVGDQQMLITILTNFQKFVDVPFISTCGRYPVHERFPLSSSSSFAFNHPGQRNGFQLILSHNMTHKSDLPANNHLQELPWRVGSLRYLFTRLRNDLYCVEWDVKLYYTIPYHTSTCSLDTLSLLAHAIRNTRRKNHISAASNCDFILLLIVHFHMLTIKWTTRSISCIMSKRWKIPSNPLLTR